ncbi:MAG: glycoside hydrolase family 31 protein [Rikenellaceae bacterium]|jgi:alpha-D-xyloside xylohydrolase|nr:glycoside hydrolase family 31 protein [Rikenellaceae bacterium]
MRLFTASLVALLFMAGQVFAQDFEKTAHGIRTSVAGTEIEVLFFNPSAVRVVKAPQGWEYTKESLSVIATPEAVDFTARKRGNAIRLESDQLRLDLDLRSGTLSFYTRGGKALIREKSAATFTDFDDAGVPAFSVYQPFVLDAEEAIYGLGQLQNGQLSQRGITKRLIQGNTEDVITFFQSVKGYGLFWDNYSPTLFTDNAEETSFNSEVGDCVDYYFMYGGSGDGVVAQMRELTGQVPMLPLWTYGFFQSKERYKSQDETVGIVRKYRELGVPLDGIIQDWQYWGSNYLWNAMEFLHEDFPDPQRMMREVHGMNAKMVISIWSSFGPMTKQYRAMEPQGMLLDMGTWPQSGSSKWPPNRDYPSGVKPYDPFNPGAREIYWNHLNDGLLSLGLDGWWMDSTEPDHLDARPSDMDNPTYLGSFRKVRNAYPLVAVGGVYDGQRAVTSDRRVFILTRSAFAGQQRYGANTWTGDVQATWDVLARQIPAGLNFSLCAIPHWNSDIGGFFLGSYPRKLEDPDYRELYARWLQFGTFTPMMRSHGADAPREIWQFGEKGTPIYDAVEKFINLRYSLLPYIYSTAWEVSARQSSLIRALMMDFVADKNVWDIADQYMFGQSLLVCPVVERMYTRVISGEGTRNPVREEDFSTVKSREVYLPKGADWYDFWTNEKLTGGQTVSREAPIDIMPLYVKAGAIVPFGPKVQYAQEKKWDDLEIRVYRGADGSFVLYEDEFDNYNYEQGAYSEIDFSWDDSARTLTIDTRRGSYPGMLAGRTFRVVLVESGAVNAAQSVSYDGSRTTVQL